MRFRIFIIFSVLLLSPVFGAAVNLNEAVRLALARDTRIKVQEAVVDEDKAIRNAIVSEILPVVKIGHYHQEQRLESIGEVDDHYRYLSVSAKLANPFSFAERLRAANRGIEAEYLEREKIEEQLRGEVRVQYFTAFFAGRSLSFAEKNLDLLRKDLELTQRRFRGGFLHISDVRRSEISLQKMERDVKTRRIKFDIEMRRLETLIGQSPVELSEEIPTRFAVEDQGVVVLQRFFDRDSIDIEIEKKRDDMAQRNLRLRRYDFFPELSVSATYQQRSPEVRKAGPLYVLSADWEIFSGGRSYFEMRRDQSRKDQQEWTTEAARRSHQLDKQNAPAELHTIVEDLKAQRSTLKSLDEILVSSRSRFAQGLIDSRQVNEDLRQYLEQESQVLETSLELITAAARLSRIFRRPELFEMIL